MADDRFTLPEGATNHYHDGEPVEPGEPFTPTEAERELLGDVLIPTEDSDDTDESQDAAEDDEAAADDAEICGVEMSGGDICERPADECPYHDADGED